MTVIDKIICKNFNNKNPPLPILIVQKSCPFISIRKSCLKRPHPHFDVTHQKWMYLLSNVRLLAINPPTSIAIHLVILIKLISNAFLIPFFKMDEQINQAYGSRSPHWFWSLFASFTCSDSFLYSMMSIRTWRFLVSPLTQRVWRLARVVLVYLVGGSVEHDGRRSFFPRCLNRR